MRNLYEDFTADYELDSNIIKFIVVGDLHLNYLTPKSRIDDYPQTCINKLETLLNVSLKNHVNIVFFEGDIFHKPQQPLDYILKVMNIFSKFKQAGVTCYSIIGNHDIKNERLDTITNSSLGILFEAGLLLPFKTVKLRNLTVFGTHYGEKIPKALDSDKAGDFNVSISHNFYEFNFSSGKDNLTQEDIINLGYDVYCLGHDHMTYDNKEISGRQIIRCGAFTRSTAHNYNMKKTVSVDLFAWNEKELNIHRLDIPCLPAEVIFSASVTSKPDLKELNSKLTVSFTNLITMLNKPKIKTMNIYSLLDDIELENNVRDRVTAYLTQAGIFRE